MATLEEALDGLQAAEEYCHSVGLRDLSKQIAELYQEVGIQSLWADEQ